MREARCGRTALVSHDRDERGGCRRTDRRPARRHCRADHGDRPGRRRFAAVHRRVAVRLPARASTPTATCTSATRSGGVRSWPSPTRPVDGPAIVVDDTVRSLGFLAGGVLRRTTSCRVVGVTGSSGKTSTKDLIAARPRRRRIHRRGRGIAQQRDRPAAHRARGRGVDPPPRPRVQRARHRPHRIPVPDRAARDRGRPQRRHRAPRGVRLARGGRRRQGRAGRGARDRTGWPSSGSTTRWSRRCGRARRADVVGFGTSAEAEVRVESLTLDARARPRFRLVTPQGTTKVSLQLSGAHQAINAAAAAAVGLAVGMSLGEVGAALGEVTAVSAHRMRVAARAGRPACGRRRLQRQPGVGARGARRAGRAGRRPGRLELGGAGRDARARGGGARPASGASAATSRPSASITSWSSVRARRRSPPVRARSANGAARSSSRPMSTVAAALLEAAVGGSDVVLVKASNAAGPVAGRRGAARCRTRTMATPVGVERDEERPRGRAGRAAGVAVRDSDRDQDVSAQGLWPADPRRRADHAPHQARHADDGRRRSSSWRSCSATSWRTWSSCAA